ncbi:hypothetical protein Taro_041193 [Colocasia esculenta]|uniref:Uncharacterized protein n=1 Tax=Colocasia esculenta TaxID=4460 RepID=A0A843WP43_COLES|nr:hypothetical protein [Colocasia esculenta]
MASRGRHGVPAREGEQRRDEPRCEDQGEQQAPAPQGPVLPPPPPVDYGVFMQSLVQAIQTQAHTRAALQAQLEAQERADMWWSSLLHTRFEDGAVEGVQRGPAPAAAAAVPTTGQPGRPRALARVFALAREEAEQADHVTEGVVFLLVKVSRGEMSLGVRIRVRSRPQHPTVLARGGLRSCAGGVAGCCARREELPCGALCDAGMALFRKTAEAQICYVPCGAGAMNQG